MPGSSFATSSTVSKTDRTKTLLGTGHAMAISQARHDKPYQNAPGVGHFPSPPAEGKRPLPPISPWPHGTLLLQSANHTPAARPIMTSITTRPLQASQLITQPTHPRRATHVTDSISAHLSCFYNACAQPDAQSGATDALLALLAAAAEYLAEAAPYTLINAPNRQELERYDPRTCLHTDAALVNLAAQHLGAVFAATAVRLPLPGFFGALPALQAHLRATLARHFGANAANDLGLVVELSLRLTDAVGAGQPELVRRTIQMLSDVLTTATPDRAAQARKRSRPIRVVPH